MESWLTRAAQKELNDPNSTYYLGAPSVPMQIQNYLNGGGYNTNYFGAGKCRYLAPRAADSFELMANAQRRRDSNNFAGRIVVGAAALIGLVLARKIPGLSWLVGTAFKCALKPIGWTFTLLGKLFK